MNANAETTVTEAVDAELAELLGSDVEIIEESEPEVAAEELVEAAAEEDIEAAVNEVEMNEAKQEAYQNQPAEKKKTEKEAKQAKSKPKKASKPKAPSVTGMATSEAVKTILGTDWEKNLVLDAANPESPDVILSRLDSLAKKQSMKAVNVFKWIQRGNNLEGYVSKALDLLIKNGSMSSENLREHYLAHPYSQGTANSQSNQIMSLFPALSIAQRDGKTLTLNENSTIVATYKAQQAS